ncbi:MAG: GH92 family glycosyl hydrolase [Myxococcales bacterium]|nr:MAG: GH92 family glycosyl hydrolase [Myxococcales bacterium]
MLERRWLLFGSAAVALSLGACTDSGGHAYEVPSPPVDAPLAAEVNPFIGTAGEAPHDGQTFPGAIVPWGMASPSPHTRLTTAVDAANGIFVNAGYRYGDPTMRGFGLTHLSGVGCPDLGVPVVAATLGPSPTDPVDYVTSYRNEVAHAGYYAVELGDRGMVAEMTATPRVGVFRFWLPPGQPANIVIDPARGVSWRRNGAELPDTIELDEIAGSSAFGGFCAVGRGGRLHFVVQTDVPADRSSRIDVDGDAGAAMASWHYERAPDAPVTVWVGLSWVGIDEARASLESERMSFDETREAAARAWHDQLGRIEVSGGEPVDRTRFYTALYHALIHPSIVHDVSGSYPRFSSGEVGNAGDEARYTVHSLWDTYRTLHPLLTLVYPEVQLDILRSLADMTVGANAPPKWELLAEEVQMMVGDPAAIVFADSYEKGLDAFDAEAVYDVLLDASERPEHRPGSIDYLALGYVPMEEAGTVWGPVSTTLEYALADWCLAELASSLGRDQDVDALRARASSYAGFFDEETGTLRPRNRDGSFLSPFDPDAIEGSFPLRLGGPGYVEGTAWNYAFFVPHDVEGLVALHGPDTFVERLQWTFDTDRFVMWNEPDMHYPYLFTFVEEEAARAQREVRRAMARYFGEGPDGLPGNDDAGTLSAWFVFSAMGFYPVTPGVPEYRLGSPLFERITIHLSEAHHSGETFVIEASGNGPGAMFVRDAELDGQPLQRPVLSHAAIIDGGSLRLRMSATPD